MEKTKGQLNGEQHVNFVDGDCWSGINKREYMATKILSGILSNRWSMELGNYSDEELAERAVKQTDALLEALSKP